MSLCLDSMSFEQIQSICEEIFEIGGVYQYTGKTPRFPTGPKLQSGFITLNSGFVFTVVNIIFIYSLGIENAYVKILTESGICYFPIFDSIPTNRIKRFI